MNILSWAKIKGNLLYRIFCPIELIVSISAKYLHVRVIYKQMEIHMLNRIRG